MFCSEKAGWPWRVQNYQPGRCTNRPRTILTGTCCRRIQSLFSSLGDEVKGQTIALGGDGRYFNKPAAQVSALAPVPAHSDSTSRNQLVTKSGLVQPCPCPDRLVLSHTVTQRSAVQVVSA